MKIGTISIDLSIKWNQLSLGHFFEPKPIFMIPEGQNKSRPWSTETFGRIGLMSHQWIVVPISMESGSILRPGPNISHFQTANRLQTLLDYYWYQYRTNATNFGPIRGCSENVIFCHICDVTNVTLGKFVPKSLQTEVLTGSTHLVS